jgi:hypothetical protein
MKKIMMLVLLTAFASAASIDEQTYDLTGTWELLANDFRTVLTFVPTEDRTSRGGFLYETTGDFGGFNLMGASIEEIDGTIFLAWWGTNSGEPRLNSEYTRILSVSATEWSLGGDYETYEIGKLRKLE